MLSPKEIVKRRLGGRSNLSTKFIQQRNSSPNDNNNSNTTKKSTPQTQNIRKTSKKASCCSSNDEIAPADDVKMDTEKERKGKNRRSTKGDKSRFELVEGAYEKSKKKSLRWADKSVKEVLTYKKNILDIVPSGFPKKKYVKDESAKVSLMEYYEDEIAGEKVIINKQLLYSTDDDKDITIIIRDYITPENFLKNVEYYRQVNKARETYMRAAAVAGDCLQRGEVEGDRDGWLLYLDKCQTDKKKWHKMCEMSHLLREKEVRYEVKKIGIFARIWKRCVEECLDIFPCCFPP